MIYRIHLYHPEEGSLGFEYHPNKLVAEDRRKELVSLGYHPELTTVEGRKSPVNKKQIIKLLRDWADHPDNG